MNTETERQIRELFEEAIANAAKVDLWLGGSGDRKMTLEWVKK